MEKKVVIGLYLDAAAGDMLSYVGTGSFVAIGSGLGQASTLMVAELMGFHGAIVRDL